MAVVELPIELGITLPLACSICQVKLLLPKATVGLVDSDNRQAFSCVSHFSEPELLIRGWADFITAERRRYLKQGLAANESLYRGWNNARLDS